MNEAQFKTFKKLNVIMPRKKAWSLAQCQQFDWLDWCRKNAIYSHRENLEDGYRNVFNIPYNGELTEVWCFVDYTTPMYQELLVKRGFFVVDLF